MSLSSRLKHELKAVAVATAFFGVWIGGLITVKTLVLEEYHIDFAGWSRVLIGALVLGKVVLILEHVPLGAWVRRQPAWVDVLLRTALYSLGLFVVLVLEHGLRERHQYGGFFNAITVGLRDAKVPHILVNTICLSGALFAYNVLAVVRSYLGDGGLLRLFLNPLPEPAQSDRE